MSVNQTLCSGDSQCVQNARPVELSEKQLIFYVSPNAFAKLVDTARTQTYYKILCKV